MYLLPNIEIKFFSFLKKAVFAFVNALIVHSMTMNGSRQMCVCVFGGLGRPNHLHHWSHFVLKICAHTEMTDICRICKDEVSMNSYMEAEKARYHHDCFL